MPAEIEKLWRQGIDWLKRRGGIVDVSLPHTTCAACLLHYRAAEASSNLARYDGVRYGARKTASIWRICMRTRAAGLVMRKRRVMIGTYALSAGYYDAYYVKALQVRRLIAEDFHQLTKNTMCCDATRRRQRF